MNAATTTTTVLVVEDDAAIQDLIRFTLEQAGFGTIVASSAEEAIERVHEILPDVALIDWMLPGMSGIVLAQRLRAELRTRALPIIMLTARADESDRVAGLEQGADDYIVKPFAPRELVARIRAVLRRRSPEQGNDVLEVGPIRLDARAHVVQVKGMAVEIGPTEFRLLRFLLAHPDRVFSRAQLLDKVWGDHVFIEERTVDVHMRRLRLTLGEQGQDWLVTVRGAGYKLARPA
jgi:two-component system phosphate regulon response regulator PhoB